MKQIRSYPYYTYVYTKYLLLLILLLLVNMARDGARSLDMRRLLLHFESIATGAARHMFFTEFLEARNESFEAPQHVHCLYVRI